MSEKTIWYRCANCPSDLLIPVVHAKTHQVCPECGLVMIGKVYPEDRTRPFLTAADLVMLREMRIGLGIKLQEPEDVCY